MLSLTLKRYYGPLRLPRRPDADFGSPYTSPLVALHPPPSRVSSTTTLIFHHMPPLLPRKFPVGRSVLLIPPTAAFPF